MTRFYIASIVFSTEAESGISLLTFETAYNSRSAFSIIYDAYGDRIFIGLLWFDFRFELKQRKQ